jgi:hypothetical protein
MLDLALDIAVSNATNLAGWETMIPFIEQAESMEHSMVTDV